MTETVSVFSSQGNSSEIRTYWPILLESTSEPLSAVMLAVPLRCRWTLEEPDRKAT